MSDGWNINSTNIYNTAICLNDVNSNNPIKFGSNNVNNNNIVNILTSKLLSTTLVTKKIENSNCSIVNLVINNDNVSIPAFSKIKYIPKDTYEESYAYLWSDISLAVDEETGNFSEKQLKLMSDHSIEYNGQKTGLTWSTVQQELPPDDSGMPGVGEELAEEKPISINNTKGIKLLEVPPQGSKYVKPNILVLTTIGQNKPSIKFIDFNGTTVQSTNSINMLLTAPKEKKEIDYSIKLVGWNNFVNENLDFNYQSLFSTRKIPVYFEKSKKWSIQYLPIFKQIKYHYLDMIGHFNVLNDLIHRWNDAVVKYQIEITPILTVLTVNDFTEGMDDKAMLERAKENGFINACYIAQLYTLRREFGLDNLFNQIFQLVNLNKKYFVNSKLPLNGEYSFDINDSLESQIYLDKPINFDKPEKFEKAKRN